MALISQLRMRYVSLAAASLFIGGAGGALFGVCGPFTDVAADSFCPFVQEIFYLGITTGTTATTFDPSGNVSRLQMAAFLSRTVDRSLQRAGRRAALGQFWISRANAATTTLGQSAITSPYYVKSDGTDIWAVNSGATTVQRVRASDGKLLETWTGATFGWDALPAMGQVFVAGSVAPGRLYWINPSQPAGAVTTVASNIADSPAGLAFDGSRIWSGGTEGAVSIVTPGNSIPWTATTVTTGFVSVYGMLFDGASVWAADEGARTLLKLDANGAVLQTVTVGLDPRFPVFDGSNIWVPNAGSSSISVIRASTGAVLATLTGNGLNAPITAAFDGERVLVTNYIGSSVSLFKAAALTPAGFFDVGASSQPTGACSDGLNFWIALPGIGKLLRF